MSELVNQIEKIVKEKGYGESDLVQYAKEFFRNLLELYGVEDLENIKIDVTHKGDSLRIEFECEKGKLAIEGKVEWSYKTIEDDYGEPVLEPDEEEIYIDEEEFEKLENFFGVKTYRVLDREVKAVSREKALRILASSLEYPVTIDGVRINNEKQLRSLLNKMETIEPKVNYVNPEESGFDLPLNVVYDDEDEWEVFNMEENTPLSKLSSKQVEVREDIFDETLANMFTKNELEVETENEKIKVLSDMIKSAVYSKLSEWGIENKYEISLGINKRSDNLYSGVVSYKTEDEKVDTTISVLIDNEDVLIKTPLLHKISSKENIVTYRLKLGDSVVEYEGPDNGVALEKVASELLTEEAELEKVKRYVYENPDASAQPWRIVVKDGNYYLERAF